MRARTLLEGCGAGILLTLGLAWNQLSPYHLDLYHRQLPIVTVVRAVAIDLVLASLLGAALIGLLLRVDPKNRTLLWTVFAAALAARAVGGLIAAEVVTRQGVTPLRIFVACAAVGCLLWFFARPVYPQAVRAFQALLLLLGFSILWILPQLVVQGFARQPHDRLSFSKPIPQAPAPHARLVWLLFDELSYDQLVDHRWNGLSMPNFDRLRGRSMSFSHVQPDGYFTEEVLPSLLLGRPVAQIRSSLAGELFVRPSRKSAWRKFDGNATLFADAERRHKTTGLVGSYNPYCRLLAGQLDRCWTRLLLFDHHLSPQRSTWGNVIAPAHAAVARLIHRPFETTPTYAEKFAAMVDAAQSLIADEDIDFVFVHLPVPHPPGIYHRQTGQIAPGGSYIDNLALADKTLGELEASLAQTQSASMTTLMVSSDHSWRVPLWRNQIGWTSEDEAASRGRFDPRPVLMVQLPGQTTPQTIADPFPALKEHDLVLKLLQDSATGSFTESDLERWVKEQH